MIDTKLCLGHLNMLLDNIRDTPSPAGKLQLYATCTVLLTHLRELDEENGYVGEKTGVIEGCLQKLCGLARGDSRPDSSNEFLKARHALEDIGENLDVKVRFV